MPKFLPNYRGIALNLWPSLLSLMVSCNAPNLRSDITHDILIINEDKACVKLADPKTCVPLKTLEGEYYLIHVDDLYRQLRCATLEAVKP